MKKNYLTRARLSIIDSFKRLTLIFPLISLSHVYHKRQQARLSQRQTFGAQRERSHFGFHFRSACNCGEAFFLISNAHEKWIIWKMRAVRILFVTETWENDVTCWLVISDAFDVEYSRFQFGQFVLTHVFAVWNLFLFYRDICFFLNLSLQQ